jgi:hypothetical protein
MTNYEYFKDEIIERVSELRNYMESFAVVDGKPVNCMGTSCGVCELNKSPIGACKEKRKAWLNSEHIEKPKLTKKERQFCELVETGWIARDRDGKIHFRTYEPFSKGFNCWSGQPGKDGQFFNLNKTCPDLNFSFITWDDKVPWSVEDLLKLEVEV